MTFEGEQAPAGSAAVRRSCCCRVGRSPNGKKIGADKAGVAVERSRLHRGRLADAHQRRRTSTRSATSRASRCSRTRRCTRATSRRKPRAGRRSHFDARVIPSVAYTDPEIAWVGSPRTRRRRKASRSSKGLFPWAASGRAIANGRDEGFTKLLFDDATHRIVGGGIVGTHAGDLISEIALAIEMGADAVDIGKTIHPHPTLSRIDRHGGRGRPRASAPICRRRARSDARTNRSKPSPARRSSYVVDDAWIGVGSGSTANFFIDELAKIKHRIKGAVASSVKHRRAAEAHGIEVEELNNVDDVPVYVDGADEVTEQRRDDQGRRRRAHAREDRRRGRAQVRLHRRPVEARRRCSASSRCRSK